MGNNNLKNVNDTIEWKKSHNIIPYEDAVVYMENRAKLIATHIETEKVWLLEHPSLYSAGTSADKTDLIDPNKFPVFHSGRGGQYTYHGPYQYMGYLVVANDVLWVQVRQFAWAATQYRSGIKMRSLIIIDIKVTFSLIHKTKLEWSAVIYNTKKSNVLRVSFKYHILRAPLFNDKSACCLR